MLNMFSTFVDLSMRYILSELENQYIKLVEVCSGVRE